MQLGIHWFRRDLRLAGNPALQHNLQKHQGRVLGLFCFDSKFLSRDDFSHVRFSFFLETLGELRKEMKAKGGDLLVLDQMPADAFQTIAQKFGPDLTVTFNRDYEPYARKRDSEVTELLQSKAVVVETFRDHLLIEPWELYKSEKDKSAYQVFTPFSKKWMKLFLSTKVQSRLKDVFRSNSFDDQISWEKFFAGKFSDAFDTFQKTNNKNVSISIPKAGPNRGIEKLKGFKSKMKDYAEQRDIPSVDGTSQLSIFLKNGSITTAQIIQTLDLKSGKFLNELIWREFYYHILWHHPRVEREAFIDKFKNIKWENNKALFKKWCDGKTGYPIIDAGMRQLNQIGWMHNRVRMIVASFLTKDLLIDWRWGENYFMKMLLDGDLAPNNGGWQWAASTGCDPQPYFRIFNPWLQAKKFDPEAKYIKTWVPELNNLSAKEIHNPETFEGKLIVEHNDQKEKALKLYKS